MKIVLHLVPYDGIGGVEEAARSMIGARHARVDVRIRYLFPDVRRHAERHRTNSIRQMWRTAREIAREPPDLLVMSLWRSVLAGMLAKVMAPRLPLVLFLHNSRDAHLLDKVVTRLGLALASAVWTDSQASVAARLPGPIRRPVAVISYLTRRLDPLPWPGQPAAPVFIFWGRLARQKNLHRAIALVAALQKHRADARFVVIGPDGDEGDALRSAASAMAAPHSIRFLGPMSFAEIRRLAAVEGAAFYLQTSRYEGMALAVVEAMQLGLVPVVTPAGEIARYCEDGRNAVALTEGEGEAQDRLAIDHLRRLLDDPARYGRLRAAAIETWRDKPLYSEAVFQAAMDVLARG